MRDRKKIAAIMAAIVSAEGAKVGGRVGEPPAPPPVSAEGANLWRVSGRQEIMQMRALWQRRIVPR
ncbi:hypothetical protein M1O17_02305 [Dehalococcoidia bacterium]|nr:hypothetical protein [Dehalococcoidia bacterium]MCL0075696.1 hypothetical protein [Dehalococcoidia bacterium]